MPLVSCLIWLIVYAIVAFILLRVLEVLLGMWGALPGEVFILLRLLAALIVLLLILGCLGLMPGWGPPAPVLRR